MVPFIFRCFDIHFLRARVCVPRILGAPERRVNFLRTVACVFLMQEGGNKFVAGVRWRKPPSDKKA